MSTALRTQELPPLGGYKKIIYSRVPPRRVVSTLMLFGGYIGLTTLASYVYYLTQKHIHIGDLEQRSSCLAILPILQAERDREYLKQLRRNRDEEAKLMANVEGWKVGTWYGEPIYSTLPPDTFIDPEHYEYYTHADPKEHKRRMYFHLHI